MIRRRHVPLVAAATSAVGAAALVVALVVLPAGAPLPAGAVQLTSSVAPRSVKAGTTQERAVALAEQEFSLSLLEVASSSSPGSNVLVSPLSADVDLAMLELGAGPSTASEIASTLRSSGLSPAEQAAAWSSAVSELLAAQSDGELQLADSLWVSKLVSVEHGYLDSLAENFDNDTYQVDFRNPAAVDAINAWVAQQTADRITKLFSPGDLPKDTELVLANALHFHAAWASSIANAMKAASVERLPFHASPGTTVDVPTIAASEVSLKDARGQGFTAAELPYTNGRFAAMMIEPTAGTMATFLRSLTAAALSSIVAALHPDVTNLSMPALNLSSNGSLDPVLKQMGLAPAYEHADLTPMFGPAIGANQMIGTVHQAVTLNVNQWGTDAAAATGVSVLPGAALLRNLTIDHPYVFLIRDTVTGTILFSAMVANPSGR
ncbi:MAG TPA: serpin family protein [Acidimicrobiales bacterium]|nr:serpin family protein [Acidimicrobiales bacterium]